MFRKRVPAAVLVFLVFGVTAGFSMSLPPPARVLPDGQEGGGTEGYGASDYDYDYDDREADPHYLSKYKLWSGFLGPAAAYDRSFSGDDWMLNVSLLKLCWKPDDSRAGLELGYVIQGAPGIFDFFLTFGLAVYPFKRVFSLSASYGIGILTFYLNHYSYIADVKAGFDIPVGKTMLLSLSGGVRRRNAYKMINYLKLSDRYFRVCNAYFAEVSYRWRF